MDEARILLIEDDPDIREGVRILLESEGYAVNEAADGETGLALAGEDTDLVILDVMMPGMSGLKVCQALRKGSNVPVLFLTARAQESDKLIGLMAGGDDYLTKPFSYAELIARVKALGFLRNRGTELFSGRIVPTGTVFSAWELIATAELAATLRESTPWAIGMMTERSQASSAARESP